MLEDVGFVVDYEFDVFVEFGGVEVRRGSLFVGYRRVSNFVKVEGRVVFYVRRMVVVL